MSTPAELLAQSLAKFQSANRIDGSRNSYRRDNPSEYAKVIAYLQGGARPTGVTSDMGMGLMLEEDARRALNVVVPPDPIPPDPPPAGNCTQTISSGLQGAIQAASAGAVICLTSGSYGAITLSGLSKSSQVTVRPVAGATVNLGLVTINACQRLAFDATGGTMNVAGIRVDVNNGNSTNLSFVGLNMTAPMDLSTRTGNLNWLVDRCRFSGLGAGLFEGRLSVRGYNNSSASGVVISNSYFGDGGCSDGIQLTGGCNGVQIGPGNEFRGIVQGNCGEHCDPIQPYDCSNTLIVGNWLHNNSTGVMSPDDSASPAIVRNNVIIGNGYPWGVIANGGDNWVCEHNVMVNNNFCFAESNQGTFPNGIIARDNVFVNAGFTIVGSNWGVNSYNLNSGRSGTGEITGTPVFVGGANPTTYAGWMLAPGSPGYHAGHDGTSMGIT